MGSCPRRIVDYGDGDYAAICRDPYQICERVPLTHPDVLLQRLDVAGFAKMLAGPLGIRWQDPVSRGDGAWGIGLSDRRDTRSHPVFLVLLPDPVRFVAVLHRLLLNACGPFLLVAPTCRHRTIEVQEMLQQRGVMFLSMEEHLLLDDAGQLTTVDREAATGAIRPTSKEDRKRVIKEFVAQNHCKVRDIQEAAGVDEADYYKWLSGKTPDHYSTCVAIERVLHCGLSQRREQQWREG